MALKKKKKSNISELAPAPAPEERRKETRDIETLIDNLTHSDPSIRRHAARDLADFPDSISALCHALPGEEIMNVRQAMLDTLSTIGGKEVVSQLIPLLKSEDAALRNGVIEVLQGFPAEVAPRIAALLNDPDSDVRIFAIDVLQVL